MPKYIMGADMIRCHYCSEIHGRDDDCQQVKEIKELEAKIADYEVVLGQKDEVIKALEAGPRGAQFRRVEELKSEQCKYCTVSHGIGLDGKVSELRIDCYMNPDVGYLTTPEKKD